MIFIAESGSQNSDLAKAESHEIGYKPPKCIPESYNLNFQPRMRMKIINIFTVL